MPNLEMKRAAARAKARETLAAMTDEEDWIVIEAAQADPDAQPIDDQRLAGMRLASATAAADLSRRRGRPPLEAPKRLVSLRLDPDVVESFRATGRGWQSR